MKMINDNSYLPVKYSPPGENIFFPGFPFIPLSEVKTIQEESEKSSESEGLLQPEDLPDLQ